MDAFSKRALGDCLPPALDHQPAACLSSADSSRTGCGTCLSGARYPPPRLPAPPQKDQPDTTTKHLSHLQPPAPRRSTSRWLVYILRCSDGSLYTGITNDLPKRLKAHTAGRASKYTRSRLPVRLAFSEPQKSKSAALKREAAIKRLRRAEKDRLVAKR